MSLELQLYTYCKTLIPLNTTVESCVENLLDELWELQEPTYKLSIIYQILYYVFMLLYLTSIATYLCLPDKCLDFKMRNIHYFVLIVLIFFILTFTFLGLWLYNSIKVDRIENDWINDLIN